MKRCGALYEMARVLSSEKSWRPSSLTAFGTAVRFWLPSQPAVASPTYPSTMMWRIAISASSTSVRISVTLGKTPSAKSFTNV